MSIPPTTSHGSNMAQAANNTGSLNTTGPTTASSSQDGYTYTDRPSPAHVEVWVMDAEAMTYTQTWQLPGRSMTLFERYTISG
ncbi:hypothetical protein HKX48_008310 [Thoreauomyces humboldtii]|nr:hypothetical protein HKX48_008310 [Thoreauomyces humboldtii]